MTFTFVIKEVGKDAEVRTVETNDVLKICQGLVNGYVEGVAIGPGVCIICNEDGLAMGLPDNCGYVGTILFVQDVLISEDEGYDWGSLDEENQRKAIAWCKKYSRAIHPDRDGRFDVISGEEEIARYQALLLEDAEHKLLEWQSL